jgi:uncharacterized protein YozE (UPF0346 family)
MERITNAPPSARRFKLEVTMPIQDFSNAAEQAFTAWLLTQKDRGDWVDDLAAAARADRTFPKNSDLEAVRAHLRKQQADGDTFQAIEDVESDWQSGR